MKYFSLFIWFLLSGIGLIAQKKQQPPNVVLILADDLGWYDLACYGSTFYETPNLNKLAAKGARFTESYATCSVCSPTRASILTGKYPVKTGVTDWIKGRQADGKVKAYEKLIGPATAYQLELKEKTIAEYALENNYATFFAGKWHLGETEVFWPTKQGFETNIGGWGKGSPSGKINDSTGGYFTPYKNATITDGPAGEYLTDRLANECIQFLEQRKDGKPFFLMYSLYAVHNPLQAPWALIDKYKNKQQLLGNADQNKFAKDEDWMKNENGWKKRLVQDHPVYAAMVENMDWNIGRIVQTLESLKMDDNTLIIFTSDNGGLSTAEGSPTTNGPLRAGKGWLYEGGIRVPLIMYWKGKITAGTLSDIAVTSADIFPTIAKAINDRFIKDKTIDGDNILQLLVQPKSAMARNLFWHYPHYSNQGGKPASAIRNGNFKLIYNYEDEIAELYNIKEDVGETNNLITKDPQLGKQLQSSLEEWLASVKAAKPVKNPNYTGSATKEVAAKSDE